MKRPVPKPTFDLLVEKRRLAVVNPETGLRFVISLRDWELCLWAVRVVRHEPSKRSPDAYETAHRLISRENIEAWLDRLVLDSEPQRALTVDLRDYISREEAEHRRWREREVAAGRLPPTVSHAAPDLAASGRRSPPRESRGGTAPAAHDGALAASARPKPGHSRHHRTPADDTRKS